MTLKFQPFRRATLTDPYYKRLATSKDKRSFWKIFKACPTTADFKDIFCEMTHAASALRPTLDELLNQHSYVKREEAPCERKERLSKVDFEIKQACKRVQEVMTDADLD
jgi:hypothetical protein